MRDAEREVRRTCSELISELLPTAEEVRTGRKGAPLIRLSRAVLDTLVISGKGLQLDLSQSHISGSLSIVDSHVAGDLMAIDAHIGTLSIRNTYVSREVFLEDVVAGGDA